MPAKYSKTFLKRLRTAIQRPYALAKTTSIDGFNVIGIMTLELRIPIVATARSDGEGKTKNKAPTQVHREDIMNHDDAFFYTNIVMSACVRKFALFLLSSPCPLFSRLSRRLGRIC